MIKIGDKVVCIDATNLNPLNTFPEGALKRGNIYNVAGFVLFGDELGLKIVGKPTFHFGNRDSGWKIGRFRKHEDIKVMNAMESFVKSKCEK